MHNLVQTLKGKRKSFYLGAGATHPKIAPTFRFSGKRGLVLLAIPFGWFGGWFICNIIKLNSRAGFSKDSTWFTYESMVIAASMMTVSFGSVVIRSLWIGGALEAISGFLCAGLFFVSLNKFRPRDVE